jgi:tetratricopeptide (TPR) repeat protein
VSRPAQGLPQIRAERSTALVGSGASADAGFPIAYEWLDELADALITSRSTRVAVKRLARRPRNDQRSSNDFLRFESFMDWTLEIFGNEDELFSFIDAFKTPTTIDQALAARALAGMRLLTVNFDDLLERAVERVAPRRALTVDVHSRRRARPLEAVPVVKLHGTWRTHSGGRTRRSGRRLRATIFAIATPDPDRTKGDRIRSAFDEHVNDRDLVVIGYSGNDELDIIPALAESSPSSVTWIDHQPTFKAPRALKLNHPDLREKPWRGHLQTLADKGIEVVVVAGQTTAALEAIGIPCRAPEILSAPDWRASLRAWVESVRFHDPTGLGMAGLILAEQGRYRRALAAFRRATPGTDERANWTEPRRRYEVGQAYYLKTPTNLDAAEFWARRSLSANRGKHRDDDWRYFALTLLGRVAFIRYDYARARRFFRQAAAIAAPGSTNWAGAVCWEGRAFTWEVRPQEALPLLLQAQAVLERSGDLQASLDAEEPLGIVCGWLGQQDKAEEHLKRAEQAAEILGWETRLFGARQNRASRYLETGRYQDAIALARKALKEFGPPANDEAAEGLDVIANAKLELGRLAEAERWFRDALAAESTVGQGSHGFRIARLAEIAFLRGNRSLARRRARAALRLSSAKRTPSSNALAACVLFALGDLAAAELEGYVRRIPPSSPVAYKQEIERALKRLGV